VSFRAASLGYQILYSDSFVLSDVPVGSISLGRHCDGVTITHVPCRR